VIILVVTPFQIASDLQLRMWFPKRWHSVTNINL